MDILYLGFLSSGTSYIVDKIFGDEGFNLRIQKWELRTVKRDYLETLPDVKTVAVPSG